MSEVTIELNPKITPDQLWDFYVRNSICEVGFGKEVATRVLSHDQVVVAAFRQAELVGLARACFDGLSSAIMEFSLDLTLQGDTPHRNGSLVEADPSGVGRRMAELLVDHLRSIGNTFTSTYVADFESPFYDSIGFTENKGHRVYYLEGRPYVDA